MAKTSGNTELKDAAAFAAEALEMDMKQWIIYDVDHSNETFSTWLEKYSPSKEFSDEYAWVAVIGHTHSDHKKEEVNLLDELLLAWDTLKESGRPINLQTITDLAKTYFETIGKWLFYVESGAKVDHLWRLVATGIVEGQLPARSAKVSVFNELYFGGKHVICIYNDDFTNEEEVYRLERAIRKIGIKCQMFYKPDVYTHFGVYRRNEWGLRPSLYQSIFEITSRQSKITKTGSK